MAATVHVALFGMSSRNSAGVTLPNSVPRTQETLSSTASSAAGTIVAAAGDVWSVTAVGSNVWVAFGSAPTAVSGGGWLIGSGQTREFNVTAAGEKIAIKDGPA